MSDGAAKGSRARASDESLNFYQKHVRPAISPASPHFSPLSQLPKGRKKNYIYGKVIRTEVPEALVEIR